MSPSLLNLDLNNTSAAYIAAWKGAKLPAIARLLNDQETVPGDA